MISPRPYADDAAMLVLSRLDAHDLLEAEAVRGAAVTHLALFGDWRAMQGAWIASWAVYTRDEGGEPFALLALAHTGQRGVAGAALLARDHRRFRRELVQLARLIRETMPGLARDLGLTRIEARAWARHPRASAFLSLTGFRHECDMPGFGRDGRDVFRLFAWTDPAVSAPPSNRPALPRPEPKECSHVHLRQPESADPGRAADRGL